MNSALLLAIIIAYFLVLLAIAFYTSRNSNNESFFIGNRNSKWWVVAFGMIGTSLSGMTFISVPGTVGLIGFDYFQVVIGYWLGYFAVAFILLPLYYRMNLTSIYTFLERRLGTAAYKTGALFFLISRTLGATLRLYLVIKVLELFILEDLGLSFEFTAVLILVLIVLYTLRGGVKTIVWTDTLQTTFMILGLLVCIGYIMHTLNLSPWESWAALNAEGYTRFLNFDFQSKGFFLKQILGGAFITIAMTGLDQEMMQKNISVSNLRDSQKNMVSFSFIQVGVVFVFLILGGLLSLYASRYGIEAAGDNLFPTIALDSGLPFFITLCFVIGLISALFPSADGALTALTSSFCIDMLGMKSRSEWDEKKRLRIRMGVHYAFALVFLGCVFFFREVDQGSLIQTLLVVAGYTYGPLLALFAFGIFVRRQLISWAVPWVCLLSPVLSYILKENDEQWLGGYQVGTELLLINGLITFALLLLFSRNGKPGPQGQGGGAAPVGAAEIP